MTLASLFPAYRLMESALMASRREAEDLRSQLSESKNIRLAWEGDYQEQRDELKELRAKHEKMLVDIANFMAYAKTARRIFIGEDELSPLPAPPVTPEQLKGPTQGRDLVAKANKEFKDALRAHNFEAVA
jgi:hypothetical protein